MGEFPPKWEPGPEQPKTPTWKCTSGPYSFSGLYFYAGNLNQLATPVPPVTIYQDVDLTTFGAVIDAGAIQLSYEAHLVSYVQVPTDGGEVRFECKEINGATLVTQTTGEVQQQKNWVARQGSFVPPPGTRRVRVWLVCHKHYGADCDGYIDEVSLIAWPAGA
jgi:hypothetical protein